MKNINFKKGFTLIELLVVVAIVAVLSSVVLAALNNARERGADAAVKTNLGSVRNQAELFSSNNQNSYLPSGVGVLLPIGACPAYNASGTNMFSRDKNIADAIVQAVSRGGNGSSCYNSTTNWVVAVGMKSSATASWCVDSVGTAKQVASAPGSAINGTTFVCN